MCRTSMGGTAARLKSELTSDFDHANSREQLQQTARLFDHLVGEQENQFGDRQAECFSGQD